MQVELVGLLELICLDLYDVVEVS
jgi:hypothetical protein